MGGREMDVFVLRTDFSLQDEGHGVRRKSRPERRRAGETCLANLVEAASAQQPAVFSLHSITFQALQSSLVFLGVGL